MYNGSQESLLPHLISKELFQVFDEAALRDLEHELEWVEVTEGEALFHQGEIGDSMYVLVRGRLGVTVRHSDGNSQIVDTLKPGAPVGEIALLTGHLRTASVHALEDAGLIRLSRESLARLAATHPQAMSTLAKSIVPRLQQAQLAQALLGLFGTLRPEVLEDLQAEFEWRHLSTGEELFHQGAPARALYVVVTGRLRFVLENPDGSPRATGEMGPGESVGEVALLTGEPRSATVYAVRETDVVRLTRERFESLAERHPQTMLHIAGHITRRLMQTIRAAPGATVRPTTFAILPLTNHSQLVEITQRLVETLGRFGPTLHLNSERFNVYFGGNDVAQTDEDHPSDVALRGWLSRQESRHQYILYEADNSWTPWTQRCLRQSDRILLVAEAGTRPHLGEVGAAIQRMERPPHVELLLLQPPGQARAAETEKWLALGPFRAHHHVRVEQREDVTRVARRMT
ncbi:MAG: cyclic nucleotide-binding domain-containing protein, partial [Ardenticatenales bacterium]|nr:cyclic nucleotide-binding domain-containing protein [Ardenticatenales bacterium]